MHIDVTLVRVPQSLEPEIQAVINDVLEVMRIVPFI